MQKRSSTRTIGSELALLGLACLTLGAGSQGRPDFSGEWIAEPENAVVPGPSTPPGPPPRGNMGSGWGSPITITQDATRLIVEHQMFSRYDLQPPLRHIYALDGLETQYPIMISHATQMRRSRAVWEGEILVLTTQVPGTDPVTGKPFTTAITQRLWLESPATLIVQVTRAGALGGEPTWSRTVYSKKG